MENPLKFNALSEFRLHRICQNLSAVRYDVDLQRFFAFFTTLFIIVVGFGSIFAQPKPAPQNSPTSTSNQPEIDDEQLLTYLLSEKSSNLHQWGAISQFHGLPSDRVNAIAQTADGLIWFGTDLGLAKFDGRRVQTVSTEVFSNLRILCLQTDRNGHLWIGTENGAFRLINDSFQMIPSIDGVPIVSIIFRGSAKIFLAAANGTVFEIDLDDQNALQSRIFSNTEFEIESLGFFNDSLLIGTKNDGLFSMTVNATVFPQTVSRLSNVRSLASNSNGVLAIGASNGVYYGTSMALLKPVGENIGSVNDLVFETTEDLWVASNSQGAFLFHNFIEKNHFTFENTAGGLRSNEVYTIFADRENVIWFGTNKGISRFDAGSPFTEKVSADQNSKFIRTLFLTKDGRVLAGTNRGLFLRKTSGEWESVNGFETKTVYSIAEDHFGKVWIGTARGLFELENPNSTVLTKSDLAEMYQTADGSVRAIRNFRNRTFLAIFGKGLAELKNSASILLSQNQPETRNVLSLHADGEQKLWFGTAEHGVFHSDGNRIQAEPVFDALKNKAVWAIEGTEKKGLWLATERGLFRYQNGELQTILPETDVRAITVSEDLNDVWCATEKDGLIRIVFDSEFGWISSRLDVEQGLPSQKIFTLLKLPFETLLIGTNRGIVRYQTPVTRPLLNPTRILSRRLHELSELSSQIVLEYPQNALTVEVSAISSRTFPEQFQFAYILRDRNGKTINTKLAREAQFLMENLAAGEYLLEVRAFDKNLIASLPLTVAFKVEKAPFPWFTLLLGILLLITLTALIWAIFSQRKIFQTSNTLRKTNLELNSARLDLANEAERERRRISRDLHDQTLADLRHLQLLSDKLRGAEKNDENNTIFRREIENVSQEIRRICEDLSPSVLENIGFTAALEYALTNAVSEVPEAQKFETSFVCRDNIEDRLAISPTEQIQIFRIVQEVLNNIGRHSGARRVTLEAEIIGENIFCLRISDDGRGFDIRNAKLVTGRGLSNIKSRSALIEAEFSFQTQPTGGTVFELRKTYFSN